jgi:hypothetical protein
MSIITDKKFINLVSPELRNFKWKKENLANCSCPICGDSKKNKRKARGYFYQKHGRFFYKCHNCDYWASIYKFLGDVSPSLRKEYSLESFKNEKPKDSRKKRKVVPAEEMLNFRKPKKPRDSYNILDGLSCLKDLKDDHPAVKFANLRIIPKQHWGILYYTDDFGSLMEKIDPECLAVGKEQRLVIPFFNKSGDVVAVQGRALNMQDENNARNTVKYITVKADKSIERLWYGLWRVDPKKRVYVVEGPIDSLFLRNATAMVGAGAIRSIPKKFIDSDMVYVLDNEPRNKQIVQYNEDLIRQGKKVCIWPSSVDEKDINDMAYNTSTRDIQKIIDNNTFKGIEATARLREWKKL